MKGRATGNEGANRRDRRVLHFMKVPATVVRCGLSFAKRLHERSR
jgi:hypothetical protein